MNDLTDFVLGPKEVAFAHSVARRYVRDPEDAADVAQDALMQAHRYRASFRGASRYTTWLFRIVTTTAFTHLRRRRRHPQDYGGAPDALIDVPDPAPGVAAVVAARETLERVDRTLDALGARYARVFRLRVEDGVPEVQVARDLGLTVATVKVRTHRARRAIRERLAADVLLEAA
jgi:RNA polymerase sigma-70 factor (ECF subfamily)